MALGAVVLTAAWNAFAQPSARPVRIGFLATSTHADLGDYLQAFKVAFQEFGYVEGKDYVVEPRFANNNLDRLPSLATELVKLNVDVIMANAATPTRAAQRATTTIPIVMISAGDPVGSGLVKTLGRPGGNITGTSNSLTDIAPKLLDVLHLTAPDFSRLAVLMNPRYQSHRDALRLIQTLGPKIRVQVMPIEARTAAEIEKGFALITEHRAEALIVITDPIFQEQRQQIARLALGNRLPSVSFSGSYAEAGFLIGYGPNRAEFWRRTAYYVDRILKGSKPGDLPVEQPSKFELVINLRTAKALNIKIPQSILLRADRIIE